jgi:hypothetical protein
MSVKKRARKPMTVVAAIAATLLLTLSVAPPAQALGYKEVNCSGGGKLYAGS